ncbi:MAG: hypothetical protein J5639_09300 [Bacteroidales bacterium]|nr:hypothetical protein [Bacteroidales bacterium]
MARQTIMVGDVEMCVACNMNALMDFLQERGTDDFSALADVSKLKPSDMLPLMAACLREGERLEGRECTITAKDLGAIADFGLLNSFMEIFGKTMVPAVSGGEKK